MIDINRILTIKDEDFEGLGCEPLSIIGKDECGRLIIGKCSKPDEVQGLEISTLGCGVNQFTVNWLPSYGATGYSIYNGSSLLGKTTGTSFTTSLPYGNYNISVYATNGAGTSNVVTTPLTLQQCPAPSIPVGVIARNLDGNPYSYGIVSLDWNDVPGSIYYEIVEGGTLLGSTPYSTFTLPSMPTEGLHEYGVRACNFYGCSTYSLLEVDVVEYSGSTTPPSTPTGLSVLNPSGGVYSCGNFKLNWNDMPTATSYQVYEGSTLIISTGISEYSFGTQPSAGSHTYSVKACNDGGCSVFATIVVNVIDCSSASAPIMGALGTTNFSSITTSSVSLTGVYTSDGGSAILSTGFVVYPSGSSATTIGGSGVLQYAAGSVPSPITVSATGLGSNTNYCAKPYAINAIGTSYGTEVCFTTSGIIYNPTESGNQVDAWYQTTVWTPYSHTIVTSATKLNYSFYTDFTYNAQISVFKNGSYAQGFTMLSQGDPIYNWAGSITIPGGANPGDIIELRVSGYNPANGIHLVAGYPYLFTCN